MNSFNNEFCRHAPSVTRLGSGSKYRRPFALVVTMICVAENGSKEFCLETRIVFECFIVDLSSSFVSKWLFILAFCVFYLVKVALVDTLCCFTVATGVHFRTVIFCSLDRMARMCYLMKVVRKRNSMAKSSSTVYSTVVSRSPIRICSVMLPLDLIGSLEAYKRDGGISSDILDSRSVSRKSFEKIWLGSYIKEAGYKVHDIILEANWNAHEIR